MNSMSDADTVWKGMDWGARAKPEDTRVGAICPVCGRMWGLLAYPPETLDRLAITARYGNDVCVTCDKHSLADVYRMYHPCRIRERRHRR